MRYEIDTKRKRKVRNRKTKKRAPKTTPRYFSINATVLTTPRHECSVFRGNELRPEVTVEAVIHGTDKSAHYVLRFTHKNCLESARNLRTGDQIRILRGRFDLLHKRNDTELRVSEFSHQWSS
jgi:hypothetical protein